MGSVNYFVTKDVIAKAHFRADVCLYYDSVLYATEAKVITGDLLIKILYSKGFDQSKLSS